MYYRMKEYNLMCGNTFFYEKISYTKGKYILMENTY